MRRAAALGTLLKSRREKTPYKVNFAITFQCTSRCTTCNIWKKYKEEPTLREKELSLQEIEAFFKKLPPTILWLSLTGGDPFLRDDLPEIVAAAVRSLPPLQVISIPSNGLLEEKIASAVEKVMALDSLPEIYLTFSLDGPPEVHDAIRGVKGAYGRTWQTYNRIKKLTARDKRFHIGLETTLSRLNIDSAEPFLRELIAQGHDVTLTIAHNADLYGNREGGELLPAGETEKVAKILKAVGGSLSRRKPEELVEKIYLKHIPKFLEDQKTQVFPCAALRASFALNAFGEVSPCLMWGEKIGSLRDTQFDPMKIWNSEKAEEIRGRIRENRCPNCWTPCEAYQSILGRPRALLLGLLP